MKNHLILILLSIMTSPYGYSQETNSPNWQFSYYGDFFLHPGFEIGYQSPIKNWTSAKTKKSKEVSKNNCLSTGLDFAYYWHPKHHHGLILSPNVSYQKTNQNGRYFQVKFNLGFHRSFVDGITYSVDATGEVKSKNIVGQNSIYNALTFDFGYDMRVKKSKPFRWFIRIGITGRFPYNQSYLPGLRTGIGINHFI